MAKILLGSLLSYIAWLLVMCLECVCECVWLLSCLLASWPCLLKELWWCCCSFVCDNFQWYLLCVSCYLFFALLLVIIFDNSFNLYLLGPSSWNSTRIRFLPVSHSNPIISTGPLNQTNELNDIMSTMINKFDLMFHGVNQWLNEWILSSTPIKNSLFKRWMQEGGKKETNGHVLCDCKKYEHTKNKTKVRQSQCDMIDTCKLQACISCKGCM